MTRRGVTPACLAALCLLWPARPAQAHAFRSGLDYYEQFQEGVSVVFAYPGTLFPILALGILVGLWRGDGIARSLPVFAVALVLGLPPAALVGPTVGIWLIALGFVTAVLAALLPRHDRWEVWVLSAAIGLFATMTSLEGHGFLELPFSIHIGILLAALFAFIASANAVRICLARFATPVTPIVFRIGASWIAAALILFLAFEWRG